MLASHQSRPRCHVIGDLTPTKHDKTVSTGQQSVILHDNIVIVCSYVRSMFTTMLHIVHNTVYIYNMFLYISSSSFFCCFFSSFICCCLHFFLFAFFCIFFFFNLDLFINSVLYFRLCFVCVQLRSSAVLNLPVFHYFLIIST